MTYKLIVPGRLPGLNEYINCCRSNPYKGAKLKLDAEKIVIAATRKQLRGLHITKPITMQYTWIEKDKRRDLDNVSSFGRKVIQDALVKTNVIKNDGWSEITGFKDTFAVDREHPRIEIILDTGR